MKLNNIKLLLGLVVVSSLTITSCLKDKDYNNGSIQSVQGGNIQVIGTGVSATNAINFLSIAVNNSNNDTVINLIPVVLSTANPAPQDIHVTLVQSDSLLTAYNDSFGKSYTVPPLFTLVNPGGVVTIPKGSNTGYLQIKFKPSDYLGMNYAIGYIISSIAEKGYVISGNLNYAVVSVITKNIYDGIYTRTGYVLRAGDPVLSGPTGPDKIHVGTFAANGNIWIDNHNWANGSNSGLASSVAFPMWTINPDNTVTVSSSGGPFPGGLENFPGYPSRYDPATKTFYVKATWGGGPGSREMTDTLVYLGPR